MPARLSDPGDSLVLFSQEPKVPVSYPLRHGLRPPLSGISIFWSLRNSLVLTFLKKPSPDSSGEGAGFSYGGRVVEEKIADCGDGEIDNARRRRNAYGSVPAFALLQSRRNSVEAASRFPFGSPSYRSEWWQHVMEYSKNISSLLGIPKPSTSSVIEDPKTVLKSVEEPTCLKAAWELMEIFYVDKLSQAWLPECLVDWLANYPFYWTAVNNSFKALQLAA